MPPVQKEDTRDATIARLEEENKNLLERLYINQLEDNKIFRLQLIQSIEKISVSLNSLNEKLTELTSATEDDTK